MCFGSMYGIHPWVVSLKPMKLYVPPTTRPIHAWNSSAIKRRIPFALPLQKMPNGKGISSFVEVLGAFPLIGHICIMYLGLFPNLPSWDFLLPPSPWVLCIQQHCYTYYKYIPYDWFKHPKNPSCGEKFMLDSKSVHFSELYNYRVNLVCAYLIFVIFFTQPDFETWKFYTWKSVNSRQIFASRQNSVN